MISPPITTEENYTVAHEENVRFVYEAWQQVEQQLDSQQQGDGGSGPIQYTEKTPSPELKGNNVPKVLFFSPRGIWTSRFFFEDILLLIQEVSSALTGKGRMYTPCRQLIICILLEGHEGMRWVTS
uniref:MAPK regulated corepressor interacting protein 2 n=1 Tax=Laticauda laticaudata TaxID=8630 RepID=A0A8C5SXC8_LATLA